MSDPRLPAVLGQLQFAFDYTQSLLAGCTEADWFAMPAGAPTHLAWQVGHLAMAEYGLALFRQRGRTADDKELMSSQFRKLFSRGTTPAASPAAYPPLAEILATRAAVHAQVLQEAPHFTAAQLDEPTEMPYAGYPTKFGALLFCPLHEMIHAGQIGLLRRLLGKPPVR